MNDQDLFCPATGKIKFRKASQAANPKKLQNKNSLYAPISVQIVAVTIRLLKIRTLKANCDKRY